MEVPEGLFHPEGQESPDVTSQITSQITDDGVVDSSGLAAKERPD
jgi:hypothetical protein